MVRCKIVSALGGNGLSDTAAAAQAFGSLIASEPFILLAGGEPAGPREDVKNAALAGSDRHGGRTVSVLPGAPVPVCKLISGQRRILLHTHLSSFARDPITGAAADAVVVFKGGQGTLIELSYAALMYLPIIFCDSRDALVKTYRQGDLTKGLERSLDYQLIAKATPHTLKRAIEKSFEMGLAAASIEAAYEEVCDVLRKLIVGRNTNFLGVPGHPEIKQRFDDMIGKLSLLRPDEIFKPA